MAEGPNEEPPESSEVDEADLQLLLEGVARGTVPCEQTRALAERLVEADDEAVWSALRDAREFESAVLWDEDMREGVMHELGLDEGDFDVEHRVYSEIGRRGDDLYAVAAARAREVVRTRRTVLHSQPPRPPTRVQVSTAAAARRAPRGRRARASSRAGPSDDGSSDEADVGPSAGPSTPSSGRRADDRAQADEPHGAGSAPRKALADTPPDPELGLPVHPTLLLFPRCLNPMFDALAASILERGLQEPVVRHEGVLVDGRERLHACRAVGVERVFREWSGAGDVEDWILDRHLRRDLSASLRAAVAVMWDGRADLERAAQERVRRGTLRQMARGSPKSSHDASAPARDRSSARCG